MADRAPRGRGKPCGVQTSDSPPRLTAADRATVESIGAAVDEAIVEARFGLRARRPACCPFVRWPAPPPCWRDKE